MEGYVKTLHPIKRMNKNTRRVKINLHEGMGMVRRGVQGVLGQLAQV